MRPLTTSALRSATVAVLVVSAACGDGDGGDGASPSTTTATTTEAQETTTTAEETTTTTEEPAATEPPSPDDPVDGDDANTLTVEQAQAQLDALVGRYRAIIADVVAARAVDETILARLQSVFTPFAATEQGTGLDPATLNTAVPPLTVSDVELIEAVDGCVSGSATLDGLSTIATPGPASDEAYFQLLPEGGSWRLGFLAATGAEAPTNIACEGA